MADSMSSGTSVPPARSREHTSMPDMPGMETSSTTASGLRTVTSSSARSPVSAVSTSNPSSRSPRRSARRMAGSSSTARIWWPAKRHLHRYAGHRSYVSAGKRSAPGDVVRARWFRGPGSACSQGQPVGREDLVDGLVVRGPAVGAVAGAAGRDALGLVAGDERAARVTGLRAGAGAGQAGHRALRVPDGGVVLLDGAAAPAGGGAGAADGRADGRLRRAADGHQRAAGAAHVRGGVVAGG